MRKLLFILIIMFSFSEGVQSQTISTFAGNNINAIFIGTPSNIAQLSMPWGVRFGRNGKLIISDASNSVIRSYDTITGIVTRIAGTGVSGYNGDNGPATSAQFGCAGSGIATDTSGNIYFPDINYSVVRKINSSGIITTIAGSTSGVAGYSGDGGPANLALLTLPFDIITDKAGNIYI
ncbi:MAG: hypothetical protein WCG87_07270 [Bacteroidota bacterium]